MAVACRRGHDTSGDHAAPAASDAFADGKRLAQSLGEWRTRWQSEVAPPGCEPLLKLAEEQALCAAAARSLARVKARSDATDSSAGALAETAELARTAARAAQKLRFRDMEYMGTEGRSLSKPGGSPSASAPPPASGHVAASPAAAAHATPFSSAQPDAGVPGAVSREDPFKPAVRAYGKLETEAERYLGAFLELGPLATRSAALTEIEKLWAENTRPPHVLQQVVRQAFLLERDPAFKERLAKLEKKTHLAPPEPSAH
ncbi:MAG TPA: hypothetical protein VGQ57_12245 [Polyangiaceae bacterium]|nr:hypothetical protein [Polyangiaceae bacterium]